eukprot:GHVL01034780.1.p1 GENE.GHVL01034780.1~~GHVL01034780.1.p1  ORF type:complete len:543 (+),score=105.15 GHVL01034780.1:1654-3282(+)
MSIFSKDMEGAILNQNGDEPHELNGHESTEENQENANDDRKDGESKSLNEKGVLPPPGFESFDMFGRVTEWLNFGMDPLNRAVDESSKACSMHDDSGIVGGGPPPPPIFSYAWANRPKAVLEYLERDSSLMKSTHVDRSLLEWAVMNRATDSARVLIDKGADLDWTDPKGWTALHLAVVRADSEMTQLLLEKGASHWIPLEHRCIPCRNRPAESAAIHFAAMRGGISVLEVLVRHGAEINSKDNKGRTPLHYAVCRSNGDVVSWMIKNGADPVAADCDNRIPLHGAVMTTEINEDVIQPLLDIGCDAYIYDNFHLRPIDLAVIYGANSKLLEKLCRRGSTRPTKLVNPPRPLTLIEQQALHLLMVALENEDREAILHRSMRRLGLNVCQAILMEQLNLIERGIVLPGTSARMARTSLGFLAVVRKWSKEGKISNVDWEYISQESKERSCALKKRKKRIKHGGQRWNKADYTSIIDTAEQEPKKCEWNLNAPVFVPPTKPTLPEQMYKKDRPDKGLLPTPQLNMDFIPRVLPYQFSKYVQPRC